MQAYRLSNGLLKFTSVLRILVFQWFALIRNALITWEVSNFILLVNIIITMKSSPPQGYGNNAHSVFFVSHDLQTSKDNDMYKDVKFCPLI